MHSIRNSISVVARSFRVTKRQDRITPILVPSWRFGRSATAPFPLSRASPSLSPFEAAFRARQSHVVSTRRLSSSTRFKRDMVSSQPEEKSLSWIPIHDTSPASFGIFAWDGYHQLISPGTRLPCQISETLVSALDYVGHDTIMICCRPSMIHALVNIVKLEVSGIREARKEDTRMKVAMVMNQDKDLTGSFTARFTPQDEFTKNEASVEFDGSRAQSQKADKAVIAT